MAVSIVKICNAALSLIGERQITNATLSDATEAERQCALIYPISRDTLIRAHPWNFAEKRQSLAALTETPDFEYSFYYQLPADCLRVLRLYNASSSHRVEANRRIATNESPCNLIYTSQVIDPVQFDPGFAEALTYHIAAHLAMILSDNRTLSDDLRRQARVKLLEAKQQDGQEGFPLTRSMGNSWISSRRGRSGAGKTWW